MRGAGGLGVVVTGIGLLSPIGIGWRDFWSSVIARRSGIRRVTRFDPTSYVCQVAGEVDDELYSDLLHPRKLRNTSKASQLGLAATELALRDAAWDPDRYPPQRIATVIGTALGGWHDGEKQYGMLLERGARRVNPFIANSSPVHATAGELAARVGARGPQLTIANGCPASLAAISHAAELIRAGVVDCVITGGVETPISPTVFAGMGRTNELAGRNDPAAEACRPFDVGHNGMVLSEGACILVLEAENSAAERGQKARARVLGGGQSCDAAGLFDLDPSAETAADAIRQACGNSGLSAVDLTYVCAHANGSVAFDRKEAAAIRRILPEHWEGLPVSSIKGVLGHPFGAAGAFQSATAILALEQQKLPPTAHLEEIAPDCALRHVIGSPFSVPVGPVLVTSYGYGGVNAALIIAPA